MTKISTDNSGDGEGAEPDAARTALADFQRRARRAGGTPRRGPSRLRITLWCIEAVVLLAAVYLCLVQPGGETPVSRPAEPAAPRHPAPVLGLEARLPSGLTEVVPSSLPATDDLALGSALMQATQLQVSRELALPVEVVNSVGIHFRLVPPGTFLMGSPPDEPGRWEEEIQHVVSIQAPFYLGKYEVTQEQWYRVMGDNPAHFRDDRLPVEEVSWYDAQRFVRRLNELENLPDWSYRLPTEAEWEYACRAGTLSAYCFGHSPERLGEFADYIGNNGTGTGRVGRRKPNALGLYDMHGNVWEWCRDLFSMYPGAAPVPADAETLEWRLLRGGNWREPAETCRSANRCRLPPLSKGNILGFRLARAITRQGDGGVSPAAGERQGSEPRP